MGNGRPSKFMKIKLFATLRDAAKQSHIEIEVAEPVTTSALKLMIVNQHPELLESMEIAVFAVNKMFADGDTLVQPTDVVALFPPVSGG